MQVFANNAKNKLDLTKQLDLRMMTKLKTKINKIIKDMLLVITEKNQFRDSQNVEQLKNNIEQNNLKLEHLQTEKSLLESQLIKTTLEQKIIEHEITINQIISNQSNENHIQQIIAKEKKLLETIQSTNKICERIKNQQIILRHFLFVTKDF